MNVDIWVCVSSNGARLRPWFRGVTRWLQLSALLQCLNPCRNVRSVSASVSLPGDVCVAKGAASVLRVPEASLPMEMLFVADVFLVTGTSSFVHCRRVPNDLRTESY